LKLQESGENYLETILILSQDNNHVRSIDIVNALGYSKPSISAAMKNLSSDGYITIGADGHIFLTDNGRAVAETMYERHVLISDWLIFLGVDKNTAVNDACKMEHVISEQSFSAIKGQVEKWKHDIYNRTT